MAERDIIVIGTSAGGVDVLLRVLSGLPAGFPATSFVVCHIPEGHRSILPEILSRAGPLLASHPADGDTFQMGQIYVAPPDRHLLLGADGRIQLSHAAHENNHRPAIDPLFRSAARHYGPRVVGVILTGALHDGVAGLLAIRRAGGLAVVQDPADALLPSMPLGATQIAGADYVAPASDLASQLFKIVRESRISVPGAEPVEHMSDVVYRNINSQEHKERSSEPSVFTCRKCGGALWQVADARVLRFRCRVGHAYNGEVLLAEQSDALEAALWSAVRTFKERSVLAHALAVIERRRGNVAAADRFDEQAGQAERYGSLIMQYVLDGHPDDSVASISPIPIDSA
jgi:two-component system chemotaxis response regulator CheB